MGSVDWDRWFWVLEADWLVLVIGGGKAGDGPGFGGMGQVGEGKWAWLEGNGASWRGMGLVGGEMGPTPRPKSNGGREARVRVGQVVIRRRFLQRPKARSRQTGLEYYKV